MADVTGILNCVGIDICTEKVFPNDFVQAVNRAEFWFKDFPNLPDTTEYKR